MERKSNFLQVKRGSIQNVKKVLQENNISGKLIYVSDSYIDALYGEIVKSQLYDIGIVKEEIVNYNTISYAMSLAERVIATDINCIIGLGGGKVLDVCKYAAYIAKVPFLSIPTTLANDGVASPIAVLKRKDDLPKSLGCAMPDMLILDIEIVMQGPIELIKAGIGDTISNYMSLLDWEYACSKNKDEMNGYAYMMSRTSLDALMKTQYTTISPEFLDVLANSLILSGIAMKYAGSSRPVSGSEHLFSHALDYYSDKKNLHGLQTALGTIAVLKIIGKDQDEVVAYLKRFDVDVNPKRLGIDKDTFIHCMQNATRMREHRYTYLHEANLQDIYLSKIYDELVEEL